MYTNIPLNSVVNIIRDTLTQDNHPQTVIHEIDMITNTVLEQNYFQHNTQFYKQKGGTSYGRSLILYIFGNIPTISRT
jgi:hypothetical protein